MAKQRAIDLQLIKPVEGRSNAKGKITLNKLQKELLTDLNVPFYDTCCESNQAPLGSPVRYSGGELEYFDGTGWVAAASSGGSRFGVAGEDELSTGARSFDANGFNFIITSDGNDVLKVSTNGNMFYGPLTTDNGSKHQFSSSFAIANPISGDITVFVNPFDKQVTLGDYTNSGNGIQLYISDSTNVIQMIGSGGNPFFNGNPYQVTIGDISGQTPRAPQFSVDPSNGSIYGILEGVHLFEISDASGTDKQVILGDLTGAGQYALLSQGNKRLEINLDNGIQLTSTDDYLFRYNGTLANHNAAAAGTLTNAPTAGNPTKWIRISDNGVNRYIPTWS